MRICDDYPKPIDLKKNEIYALKMIGANSNLRSLSDSFELFASSAYKYYESLKNPKRLFNLPIDFENGFDIFLNKIKYHIIIGVKIITKKNRTSLIYDEISYSLSIGDKTNNKLIRRFHFDYLISEQKSKQPVYHFQYPGENSPYIKTLKLDNSHMNPEVSEPRFFYLPTTFSILLHNILIQFKDDKVEKILETDEWRSLIRDNEKFILKKYFENCNSFFSMSSCDKKLFTSDFYYGEKFE